MWRAGHGRHGVLRRMRLTRVVGRGSSAQGRRVHATSTSCTWPGRPVRPSRPSRSGRPQGPRRPWRARRPSHPRWIRLTASPCPTRSMTSPCPAGTATHRIRRAACSAGSAARSSPSGPRPSAARPSTRDHASPLERTSRVRCRWAPTPSRPAVEPPAAGLAWPMVSGGLVAVVALAFAYVVVSPGGRTQLPEPPVAAAVATSTPGPTTTVPSGMGLAEGLPELSGAALEAELEAVREETERASLPLTVAPLTLGADRSAEDHCGHPGRRDRRRRCPRAGNSGTRLGHAQDRGAADRSSWTRRRRSHGRAEDRRCHRHAEGRQAGAGEARRRHRLA